MGGGVPIPIPMETWACTLGAKTKAVSIAILQRRTLSARIGDTPDSFFDETVLNAVGDILDRSQGIGNAYFGFVPRSYCTELCLGLPKRMLKPTIPPVTLIPLSQYLG